MESKKRPICSGCNRPCPVCYCAGLPDPKVQLSCNLLILQDPREDKQAFNSVRLLERSISNIEVKRGRYFPDLHLDSPVLVYPSPSASSVLPDKIGTIIFIDATWSFAKSLYNKNIWLKQIPNVILKPVNEPIYSALRRPPKTGLVSTAEAVILFLEELGDLDQANSLRRALQYAVDAEPWQKQSYQKDLPPSSNKEKEKESDESKVEAVEEKMNETTG